MPKNAEKKNFSVSLGNGPTASSHFGKPGNSSSIHKRDKDLGIFHLKEIRKPSLPSLSTLLSSDVKDSGLSPLIDESQPRFTEKKYVEKRDIFVGSTRDATSPIDVSRKNCNDYKISHMFSDGLSDAENIDEECNYAAESEDSDIEVLQGRRKQEKIEPGIFHRRSNSNGLNQEKINTCKMNNSLPKIIKSKKSSSSTLPTRKKDFGTAAVPHDSIDESRKPTIREDVIMKEPFIVRVKKYMPSPVHSNDRSTPDMFEKKNLDDETIDDVAFDTDSIQSSVSSVLSKCNLDVIGSQDFSPLATRSLDKRSTLCTNANNLTENPTMFQNTGIDCTSKLGGDELDSDPTAAHNSEDNSQPSYSNENLFEIGSQLSGHSKMSFHSSSVKFKLSPRYTMSSEYESPIIGVGRNTSCKMSQSEYLRRRRPSLSEPKKSNDVTSFKFNLSNLIAEEIEENIPEVRHAFSKSGSCNFLKRRRPSETNIRFFNVEINSTYKGFEREEPAAGNSNRISGNWLDKFSSTRFERSSQSGFSRTSHGVQSFVREWLDKQDETNSQMYKRRRLDEGREISLVKENIDIDPESLFSNYSCEYNEAYSTRRFQSERNCLRSNNGFSY